MDGLFLVESRYAPLNFYLIIFGLLGQLFFLIALDKPAKRHGLRLALSGLCIGASASVKTIFLILLAFIFWLPVFLGLPLSPQEFQSRMWLPSWI
jgi:dolichyl-phosphate-mannose--protein O-mannosyl transferase